MGRLIQVCRFWRIIIYTFITKSIMNNVDFLAFRRFMLINKFSDGYALLVVHNSPSCFNNGSLHDVMRTHKVSVLANAFIEDVRKRCGVEKPLIPDEHLANFQLGYLRSSNENDILTTLKDLENLRLQNVSSKQKGSLFNSLFNSIRLMNNISSEVVAFICVRISSKDVASAYIDVLKINRLAALRMIEYMPGGKYTIEYHLDVLFGGDLEECRLICRRLSELWSVEKFCSSLYGFRFNGAFDFPKLDAFLIIGLDLPYFRNHLFSRAQLRGPPPQRYVNGVISRYIQLGYFKEYCSTEVYAFGKNTITTLQFACLSYDKELIEFIVQDPKFKVAEHMGCLRFFEEDVNSKLTGRFFVENCIRTEEEVQEALAILSSLNRTSKYRTKLEQILNDKIYDSRDLKKLKIYQN
jgi:hypothetical protein